MVELDELVEGKTVNFSIKYELVFAIIIFQKVINVFNLLVNQIILLHFITLIIIDAGNLLENVIALWSCIRFF